MTDTNRNALAELKDKLLVFDALPPKEQERVVRSSARIVAELAKVEQPIQLARGSGKTFTHLYEFLEADKNRAVEIVRNCRIIAREGAGDGK